MTSRRKKCTNYTGPSGRLKSLSDLGKLDKNRWRVQPKLDGQYAEVHTDNNGKIFAVTSRNSRELSNDLIGIDTNLPYSILCGEYTGHTESGIRQRERLGYDSVYLFDLVQQNGRSVAEKPYGVRRDILLRQRARTEIVDRDRPWRNDKSGRAHGSDGRFKRRIPRGWRRLPIVESYALSEAEALWEAVTSPASDFLEGLVAVAEDAPLGRRRSKMKLKPAEDLDAVVISVDAKCALLHWVACDKYFTVSKGRFELKEGDIVEIIHEGFYDDLTPRFPRIRRLRLDI